jgi:hypothetical protein
MKANIEVSNEILQKPLNPNIKKYKLYGKIMTYVTNKTKINKKI